MNGSRRIVAWSGLLGFSFLMTGVTWATQSVEVPIWAILVLTFVPLESIVEALKVKLPSENQTNG